MTMPSFNAEVSVYRSNRTYVTSATARTAAAISPQQFRIGGSINVITPPWVRNCLANCGRARATCLNNLTQCAVACEPQCEAGCQIRCLSLPLQRQEACLAGCSGSCYGSCASHCRIACDTAYQDCVDFCYHPRFVRQGPVISLG